MIFSIQTIFLIGFLCRICKMHRATSPHTFTLTNVIRIVVWSIQLKNRIWWVIPNFANELDQLTIFPERVYFLVFYHLTIPRYVSLLNDHVLFAFYFVVWAHCCRIWFADFTYRIWTLWFEIFINIFFSLFSLSDCEFSLQLDDDAHINQYFKIQPQRHSTADE